MKLVITGSLGHISKPLTEELVKKGHSVTVISSKSDKRKEIEGLGAKAAIGTIEDVEFLSAAFKGADAVYTMLPPPNFTNHSLDLTEHCRKLTNNYAKALQQAGVKRIVHLSSIGAHLKTGSGLILLHRQAEDILGELSGVATTFMRPVGFYYNLFAFLSGIKASGTIASNYGAEDNIPWVSPIDIAAAIAQEIVTPLVGRKIQYVASEELTCKEAARILGAAIGKPDLLWSLITNEELRSRYESFGMNKAIVAGLVEMQACMHNGPFYDDYHLHKPSLGKIKMKDFAKEFAAVYKQS